MCWNLRFSVLTFTVYLNTSIEELVIAALHPDHTLVQIWGIQNIFGLESQIVPE